MERMIEIKIGPSPTLDKVPINSPRLKNPMFKRFYDDLNRDRKKDMSFFFNNLETIKLKYINSLKGICYDAAAQYSMDQNIIEVVCKDRIDTFIDHELLHMSSSILDEDGNVYSGFIQTRGDIGIGYGLDEGYTSILDDRYFLNRTEEKPKLNQQTYCVVKYIARMVEQFVGQEEMEDLYFTANLYDLVDFLASYTSLYEATQFVHNIDEILLCFEQKKNKNYFLCLKKFAECNLFMCEAWYSRITLGYMEGRLTEEEYNNCLEDIKGMLNHRISLQGLPIKSPSTSHYFDIIRKKVDKKLLHYLKLQILKDKVKNHVIENDKKTLKEEYKRLDKKIIKAYKGKDTIDTN